ncbi:MAG TPA: hypothetical protein VG348_07595 [Acidimicrobiia bacterium]|jgi:hypothetical protein|nr:hypothetical protein [Acidimicrobiia bacterium]
MLSQRKRLLILAVPVAASLALAGPASAAGSDKAILKGGVITKADVPAEWTSKRSNASSDALKGLKECKKINTAVAAAKKDEPRARSREFTDPVPEHATTAENAVYAFQNSKDAGKFVSAYNGSAATACFTRLGTEVERNRPASTPPTVSPITDLQGVGDQAVGYEIAATFTQNGGEATLYIDFIVVRVGRAVLGFAFTNVGSRITQGPDIVNAVVQRVAAAQK